MRSRWILVARHAPILAFLWLAVLVAFSRVIGDEQGLVFRDTITVFKPLTWAAVEALKAGHIPYLTHWNPTGVPLEQATASGVFTPMTVLAMFGDFDAAYDRFVIGHYLLLATGAYVLALDLGADRAGAALAALIGTLSGPVLSLENLLVMAQGIAWLPWLLLFFRRTILAPGPIPAALLGLCFAFHGCGILPEVMLLDALAALAIWIHAGRPTKIAALGWATCSLLIGLAVLSIDILPILETLSSTRRGQSFSYAEIGAWPLPFTRIPELFVPTLWATPELTFVNLPDLSGSNETPYFVTLYFGSSLALVATVFAIEDRRRLVLPLTLLVIGVLLALGPATPLHAWLSKLPIFSSARFPIKYTVWITASLAALGPAALSACRRRPRVLLLCASFAFVVVGVLHVSVASPEMLDYLREHIRLGPNYMPIEGLAPTAFPEIAQDAMRPRLWHATIFPGLLLACAIALELAPRHKPLVIAGAVALVGCDLAWAGRSAIFGTEVAEARLPEPVHARIASPTHRVFVTTPYGRRAPVAPEEGRTYFDVQMRAALQRGEHAFRGVRLVRDLDPDGQSNPLSTRTFALFRGASGEEAERLLARQGVGWLLTWLEHPRGEPYPIEGGIPQYVVPIEDVRPYLQIYERWIRLDEATARDDEALRSLLVEPATWGTAIVAKGEVETMTSTTCEGAELTVRDQREDEIFVATKSACATVVVAQEIVMPGWFVEVDGASAPLLNAELAYLAVHVPPGEHEVRFFYRPFGARWLPVAVSGCLAALLLLAWGALRSRRKRHAPDRIIL